MSKLLMNFSEPFELHLLFELELKLAKFFGFMGGGIRIAKEFFLAHLVS